MSTDSDDHYCFYGNCAVPILDGQCWCTEHLAVGAYENDVNTKIMIDACKQTRDQFRKHYECAISKHSLSCPICKAKK